MIRSYEVEQVQGCWVLTLFEGDEERGGGVFAGGDRGYFDAMDVVQDWLEGVQ